MGGLWGKFKKFKDSLTNGLNFVKEKVLKPVVSTVKKVLPGVLKAIPKVVDVINQVNPTAGEKFKVFGDTFSDVGNKALPTINKLEMSLNEQSIKEQRSPDQRSYEVDQTSGSSLWGKSALDLKNISYAGRTFLPKFKLD